MRYYEIEIINKFGIEAETEEEAIEIATDGTHLDRYERTVFVGGEQSPDKN